ncbi:hypothetical protein J0S82_002952 [Galemys pyrenaicus]|uniref:Uncharacterized protein n=1 Tax=Galemys pyrenaicus TaxID=202257 RepID=A0A8J6AEU9_GALPY|nr:hypothetical protein J0S82_002952 [Galemys pyrenaicus]
MRNKNSKGDVDQVQVEQMMSTVDPEGARPQINQGEVARNGQGTVKTKEVAAFQVVSLTDVRVLTDHQEHVGKEAMEGVRVSGNLAAAIQIVSKKGNQEAVPHN